MSRLISNFFFFFFVPVGPPPLPALTRVALAGRAADLETREREARARLASVEAALADAAGREAALKRAGDELTAVLAYDETSKLRV